MTQTPLDCSGCGAPETFAQPHPGQCPDLPGEPCPEWFCTTCGSALLIFASGPFCSAA